MSRNTGEISERFRRIGTIGARLSAVIPDVVDRYHQQLLAVGNPLGTTPELWAESKTHASLLLASCAQAIDLPEDVPEGRDFGDDLREASALGSLWACCRARLTDSLTAMDCLVRIALDTVVDLVADLPAEQRATVIARGARLINKICGLHTRAAAFSYDAYLLRQIEQANADDRMALARDIHDRLGATLVLAFRHLELYRAKTDREDLGAEHLAAIQKSLEDATNFTRRTISGLRADAPLHSLVESLDNCASSLNFRNLPVHIAVNGDETWLSEHVRAEIFLVLHEFMRNSFAHAAPESVAIRVGISPHRVDVEALDDGIGFDPSATQQRDGAGLSVMRERTERLGGQFFLTSARNRGTCMRLWIPLPKRRDDS